MENNGDYRLEYMINKITVANKYYMNFNTMISSGEYDNCIYCFVEGKEDFKYYKNRVENIGNCESAFVVCEGRDNVIKVNEIVRNRSEFNNYKKLYFVDKDFNEVELDNSIYELPCYSFENLYCTEETVENIIEHNIGYQKHEKEFKYIMTCYKKTFEEYLDAILDFNVFVYYEKYKKNDKNIKLNLDDKNYKVKNLVNIQLYSVNKIFQYTCETSDDEIKNLFKTSNRAMKFRGKQNFEFLHKFISLLEEDINNKEKKGFNVFMGDTSCRITTKINLSSLSVEHLKQQFSNYAITPACLKLYISKI